jgi:hypothetical protein
MVHLARKIFAVRDEYRGCIWKINRRVHKVWNRRFTNTIELENYKFGNEQNRAVCCF